MLTERKIASMSRLTQRYWTKEIRKPYFSDLASGKEIGHRIADLVDDKTAAILTAEYLVKHEHNSQGKRKYRSMGDIWLEQNGIYHPINIKTGIVGREGQPNLVSIKKLTAGLLAYRFDSYYLLIVKFDLPDVSCATYMVDMLDYLDYVTFDAGPGQTMLMARKFFAAQYDNTPIPKRSMKEKIEKLMSLIETGHRRLIKNRRDDLKLYQEKMQDYLKSGWFNVTTETQRMLNLR
ncbi:MAG: hypothetical protein OXU22_04355 [Gammaproteobacteria bacterium]|nr:hypothetical protein [Gammaproteobacteria bacterium]